MKITLRNEMTGLFNSIEFKLFEEFKGQKEYMSYLINSMNINMDSILHIKARTQQHFAKEHLKRYLFDNGFIEDSVRESMVHAMAQQDYCEMMSNVCIGACIIHHKTTLKPDLIRRKKLADEYEQNFLGNLNEKKT